jgi:peptidoglycan/LPS O-acetylase OafA/YrhL
VGYRRPASIESRMDPCVRLTPATSGTAGRRTVTTETRPTPAPRVAAVLPSLTALRSLAAFGVVAFHLSATLPPPYRPVLVNQVFFPGGTGVSFFFILSGFVLAWGRQDVLAVRDFYRRRVARIYPDHLLTFGVSLLVIGLSSWSLVGNPALVPLLAQAWVPRHDAVFAVNPVTWSLSCEVAFYALFPVLAVHLRRMSSRQRRAVAIACVAISVVIPLVAHPWQPGPAWYWVVFFPPSRAPEFALGMVLALEMRDGWQPRLSRTVATLLAAFAMIALGTVRSQRFSVAAVIVPYAAVIVAYALGDLRGSRTVLRSRPAVRLGQWSYAIFLVHVPVIYVVRDVIRPARVSSTALSWILVAAITTAVGAVIYHFWERPFERLLRPDHRERTEERAL